MILPRKRNHRYEKNSKLGRTMHERVYNISLIPLINTLTDFHFFKYRQLSELVNSNYFKLENETLVACCSTDVLGVNAEPFSEHIRQSSTGFYAQTVSLPQSRQLCTNSKQHSTKRMLHNSTKTWATANHWDTQSTKSNQGKFSVPSNVPIWEQFTE